MTVVASYKTYQNVGIKRSNKLLHDAVESLIKSCEYSEEDLSIAKKLYNEALDRIGNLYDVCHDGWKNVEIREFIGHIEVVGCVPYIDSDFLTIKRFEFKSEDERELALRNAIELTEIIKDA